MSLLRQVLDFSAAAATAGAAEPQAAAKVAPAVCIISGLTESELASIDATFRDPVRVDNRDERATQRFDAMHPNVRAAVSGFLRAKEMLRGEVRDNASVAVAPVPLRCYRAQAAATMATGVGSGNARVAVFLVGDSCFGVPFFRAANNGFFCGSEVSKRIASALPASSVADRARALDALSTGVTMYKMYVSALAGAEFMRAKAKVAALVVARGAVKLQSKMPVQMVSLDGNSERQVRQAIAAELAKANVTVRPVAGHVTTHEMQ